MYGLLGLDYCRSKARRSKTHFPIEPIQKIRLKPVFSMVYGCGSNTLRLFLVGHITQAPKTARNEKCNLRCLGQEMYKNV